MFKNFVKIMLRNLYKYKVYSAVNIAGLASGMACCLLIFLWVRYETGFDQFHTKHNRIYRLITVSNDDPESGVARVGAPWGPALKQSYPEVEDFLRFRYYGRTLIRSGDIATYESNGVHADSSFFSVLDFKVLAGNPETALLKPNSIVLTESIAEKFFGSTDIINETLVLDNKDEFVVTAVIEDVPKNSHLEFSFLVPFMIYDRWDLPEWQVQNFHVYLLMRESADIAAFEASLDDFLAQHVPAKNITGRDSRRLQRITDIHLHSNLQREFKANGSIMYVYVFSIVAVFILVIAGINFVNLTTARSANRAKEVGIRKVVGSGRKQLIRQFLSESVFLSLLACTVAILAIKLALPDFNQFLGTALTLDLTGNPGTIVMLLSVTTVIGILAGTYPAFFLSAFQPVKIIKGEKLSSSRSLLRQVLVITQFAISICLIVGTLIVFKQLNFMSEKKLGFEKEQVVVIRLNDSKISKNYQVYINEILQDSRALEVALSSNLLGGGDWGMPFKYEGGGPDDKYSARTLVVDQHFLKMHNIKLLSGRNFSEEIPTDISKAYIINETAANELGWENPIGKSFGRPLKKDESGNWQYEDGRIIGVIEDFHFRSLHQKILPMALMMVPEWYSYISVKIKTENLAESLKFLERTWLSIDPNNPFDYLFMDELFAEMYTAEQKLLSIFGIFTGLAIFLACLGLFGMGSFVAEQRTKEIGVRKILGASVTGIIFLLSKDFAKLVLVSMFLAVPVSYYFMQQWLSDFAYRINIDSSTFLIAGAATLLIALVTVGYQTVKTAYTNPVNALRYE